MRKTSPVPIWVRGMFLRGGEERKGIGGKWKRKGLIWGGSQGVRWAATLPALRATLPTVVPADSRPLSWPPIGALPRNRLAVSATGGAAAISPYAGEALGTGGTDCHTSDIGHWFAMTRLQEMRYGIGGGVRAPRPTVLDRGILPRTDLREVNHRLPRKNPSTSLRLVPLPLGKGGNGLLGVRWGGGAHGPRPTTVYFL